MGCATAFLFCWAACSRIGEMEPDRITIALQPLGEVSSTHVETVKTQLEETQRCRVKVFPPAVLPKEAFYPPRQRYRADRLLDYLDAMHQEADKVLGLTEVDISMTKGEHKDWGVFGLARIGGRPAVVSVFRLQLDEPSAVDLARRLGTVATHEIGHTQGLKHCPTVGCILEDARGKVATVDRAKGFCRSCKSKL